MFESKKQKEERKEEKERKKPPKHRFKSICIFSESNIRREREFIAIASEVGNVLAVRKINFVCGGGIQGLRGSATISVSIKGSKILSVHVKELDSHIFSIGHELQVSTLPQCMGCMFYNVEAFIALPSGLKMLDEISSITYWAKLNFHKMPLGLLNANDFYYGLWSFLDHVVKKGFLP